MSTVDLLLVLSGKLADVLSLLLEKRFNRAARQEAENLIREYRELQKTHAQISNVISKYNAAVESMLVRGSPHEVFPFCTSRGTKQVEHLFRSLVSNAVSYEHLNELEVLSVNLVTEKIEERKLGKKSLQSKHMARAYTRENWTTIFKNGDKTSQDVANCYSFLLRNNHWRIDNNETFTPTSS
jgi:hypothetical protein